MVYSLLKTEDILT